MWLSCLKAYTLELVEADTRPISWGRFIRLGCAYARIQWGQTDVNALVQFGARFYTQQWIIRKHWLNVALQENIKIRDKVVSKDVVFKLDLTWATDVESN